MSLLIYSPVISSRLDYILSVLFSDAGLNNWEVTNDADRFTAFNGNKMNYSSEPLHQEEFWIKPAFLLFENGVEEQSPGCFFIEGSKAFFKTDGDFPFDIFAASFYLLSRYEEYLPHTLDSYGRYAFENSMAFKQGFLEQPLINTWLKNFRNKLAFKFPSLQFHSPVFAYMPTIDIDMAWSYRDKGVLRNGAGLLRSMVYGEWLMVKARIEVLLRKKKDPFDIYHWLHDLHQKYNLELHYFFLLAEKNRLYDKNIFPSNKNFRELIQQISSKYKTGIHPSWQSGDDTSLLTQEILTFKAYTGKNAENSRQHYIRMSMPDTYRQLITAGVKNDFSMGYGSINGFRASYCLPYKWYDLQNEEVTGLTIYPFCFMDANSHFEQHYTLEQARAELEHYYNITKQADGTLITIWHNHLLGNKQLFEGWTEMYEDFLARHFSNRK